MVAEGGSRWNIWRRSTFLFVLQTKKEKPFSPWKQNGSILCLCSPFYSKRALMCRPRGPGQGLSPFYKFYQQENWETEKGEPWGIQYRGKLSIVLNSKAKGIKFNYYLIIPSINKRTPPFFSYDVCSHLILITILWDKNCILHHVSDAETGAWKS